MCFLISQTPPGQAGRMSGSYIRVFYIVPFSFGWMALPLAVSVFLSGILVLIGALVFNILEHSLGISTWYTFSFAVAENGFGAALRQQSFLDILFLFFMYPLFLGFVAYWSLKLVKVI